MKNDNEIKEDTNGRIHSLDQGFRSLEKRLRAVERRLSAGDMPEGLHQGSGLYIQAAIDDIRTDILAITERLDILTGRNPGLSLEEELDALRQQTLGMGKRIDMLTEDNLRLHSMLEKASGPDRGKDNGQAYNDLREEFRGEMASIGQRLEKAEKQNRIHIGAMQVPLEMSGIVGALVLALTGGLIIAGRWDIIRSPYFSFAIALSLAAPVLIKFYLTNISKA
jgi:chromosome segregation ATPase